MRRRTVSIICTSLVTLLSTAHGATTSAPEEPAVQLRWLYEACRIRQQQTGRFPASFRDLAGVLSEEQRRRIPGGVQFENPESPENQLRRRSPLGDRTPCLRLPLGSNRWLNVACNGVLYESDLFWESQFVHFLPRPFANPALLAQDVRPMPQRATVRSPRCGERQVNLVPYCNAIPTQPWFTGPTWKDGKGRDAKGGEKRPPAFGDWIATGVYERSNRLFDVRAVIQLEGELSSPGKGPRWIRSYPREVSGIAVGQPARFLELLLGTVGKLERSAVVATLRVHYSRGSHPPAELPLRYGAELAAHDDHAAHAERLYPVGSEVQPISDPTEIRYSLHHVRLENPHPDRLIESVDFLSAQVMSHPYILAITVEP